ARMFAEQALQHRLLEAQRRLAEGRSVTEVAHALGYASDSAFIAMYRRVCGQSPGRALRGLE
ncbi:helix-turn-helix domain-containing protein, partial [Pseudomonas aeruginosa]|nr:helix-turn-helix domain-containing protein [Pseudomonas aeruginosa]